MGSSIVNGIHTSNRISDDPRLDAVVESKRLACSCGCTPRLVLFGWWTSYVREDGRMVALFYPRYSEVD